MATLLTKACSYLRSQGTGTRTEQPLGCNGDLIIPAVCDGVLYSARGTIKAKKCRNVTRRAVSMANNKRSIRTVMHIRSSKTAYICRLNAENQYFGNIVSVMWYDLGIVVGDRSAGLRTKTTTAPIRTAVGQPHILRPLPEFLSPLLISTGPPYIRGVKGGFGRWATKKPDKVYLGTYSFHLSISCISSLPSSSMASRRDSEPWVQTEWVTYLAARIPRRE
ncbi:hypothetical protein V8F20_003150 [Naviculisporaceae sp. PSN 640]